MSYSSHAAQHSYSSLNNGSATLNVVQDSDLQSTLNSNSESNHLLDHHGHDHHGHGHDEHHHHRHNIAEMPFFKRLAKFFVSSVIISAWIIVFFVRFLR